MHVKQLAVSMLLWHSALGIFIQRAPRLYQVPTTTEASYELPTAANVTDTVITSSGSSSTQVSGSAAFKPTIVSKQWGWSVLGQKDKKKISAKFGGGGVSVYKDAKGVKKGVMWRYNGTGTVQPLNESQIPDELFTEEDASIQHVHTFQTSDSDSDDSDSDESDSDESDFDEDNNEVEVRERRHVRHADGGQNGRARRDSLDDGIRSSAPGEGNSQVLIMSIVVTLLTLTVLG